MNQIRPEDLEFLEEAKLGFLKDRRLATYMNKEHTHIALRTGFSERCIAVYRIDDEVGNFTEVLPKKYDEERKWRELHYYLEKLNSKYDNRVTVNVSDVLAKMNSLEQEYN